MDRLPRDIVWSGDKIVWTNLIFIKLRSLFFLDFLSCTGTGGHMYELKFNDIPIWGRWDESPSPQAKILFDRHLGKGLPNKCGLVRTSLCIVIEYET